MFCSSEANERSTAEEAVDEPGDVVVVAGQLAVELVQRGDQPPQVRAPLGDRAVDGGEVAVRRLEAAEQVAQVAAAALQAAAERRRSAAAGSRACRSPASRGSRPG